MLIPNIGNTAQTMPTSRAASDSAGIAATHGAPVEATTAKPVEDKQPSPVQLKSAVDNLNKTLTQNNKNIQFSVDSDSKRTVVKLVDTETGDTISQYPTKQALAISQSINQTQQGLLLKQKA